MQRGGSARLIVRTVSRIFTSPSCVRASVVLNHLRHSTTPARAMAYSTIERGQPNTLDYRVFFKDSHGTFISPFHDIPLFSGGTGQTLNMVVEIPRWSNAKMEINKEEKLNPLKQDVKKGALRYVKNIFPHHGYIWNYGALPQTWEDPNPKHKFEETNTNGDNDPLDVCEIGEKIHPRGAVIQVKVLGTMLLVDEGETDWKIIAIDVTDPLARKLNDIDDVNKEMPGFLRATYEWFRYYKVPDDKPENTVHWGGICKDKAFAMTIIKETNDRWQALLADPSVGNGISCVNTSVRGCPDTVSPEKALAFVQEEPRTENLFRRVFSSTTTIFRQLFHPFWPRRAIEYSRSKEFGESAPIDQSVNKWYYVIPQQH